MLRSDIQDRKPDIPQIPGEYLKELIEAYHSEKIRDSFFGIEFFVSPIMRELDRFYHLQLAKKMDVLTPAEFFSLCKIIFSPNKKSEKTKHLIDTLLLAYFDPNTVAVLDSAVARSGNLNLFEPYFEHIFKNSSDAAYVVDAVMILDHVIHHPLVRESERSKLFSKKLLDEMKNDPKLAVDIVNLHRLANSPQTGLAKPVASTFKTLDNLLARDALFFISLKLYQQDKLTPEKLTSLQSCSKTALKAIADEVATSSDPMEPVNQYLKNKSLPLCAIFSPSKGMEERRLEYLKQQGITLEEKRNEPDSPPSRKMSASTFEV